MKMAWKEMRRNKVRFAIVGSIVFLVSVLTFVVSGLAAGLSQDNAALVKNLPEGTFYMREEAEGTYSFSAISSSEQAAFLEKYDGAALSIQMGFVNDESVKQHGVAFVGATDSPYFPEVANGEVVLDRSLEKDGIAVGDRLVHPQSGEEWEVVAFADQEKFSHSPVAFISESSFQQVTGSEAHQLLFLAGDGPAVDGMETFGTSEFLSSIPSYNAEQLSLSMIVTFLLAISGLLFAIFFYMMNVQKLGLYGILKAIGVRTSSLFLMMWTQMALLTTVALLLAAGVSQLFVVLAPAELPFYLTAGTMLQLSAIFFAIGFAGATLSGVQIKKVEPLRAIQQGEM